MNLFISFYCLIKWFFYGDLCFILFFVLSSFDRHDVTRRLVANFYLGGGARHI